MQGASQAALPLSERERPVTQDKLEELLAKFEAELGPKLTKDLVERISRLEA